MWNPRGGELFFIAQTTGTRNLMDAHVQPGPEFKVLRIERLFTLSTSVRQRTLRPSADGSRFLAMDVIGRVDSGAGGLQLVLMQNFATELRRRLP